MILNYHAQPATPVDLPLPQSQAVVTARLLGVPDEVFAALCEWFEQNPVDSRNMHYRYESNTRALALRACRLLVEWKADVK